MTEVKNLFKLFQVNALLLSSQKTEKCLMLLWGLQIETLKWMGGHRCPVITK